MPASEDGGQTVALRVRSVVLVRGFELGGMASDYYEGFGSRRVTRTTYSKMVPRDRESARLGSCPPMFTVEERFRGSCSYPS